MADEEKNESTEETPEETPAEEPAAEAADEAPAEEPAADEAPPEEPAAEEPAAEEPAAEEEPPAEEAPAEEAPAPAAAAEDEEPSEEPTPKQRRKLERSTHTGEAKPQRSPEERAAERAAERTRLAANRRRRRAKERPGGETRTGTPPAEREPGSKRVRLGKVVSDKADKTITVQVEVVRRHPVYEKVIRRSTTIHAHDERNEANVGDTVRVIESRPLSRTKRWRLTEILERARCQGGVQFGGVPWGARGERRAQAVLARLRPTVGL
jgi:small subunit ribosomal protein S17